jgi:hypothetical protein
VGVPVDDIMMPVDTPLTNRVPFARMLICTVMVLEEPLRVNVSVPLVVPPPTVTLLAVIWIVQVWKVTDLPASDPCVKVKVQDPKVVLPVDAEFPLVKLNASLFGAVPGPVKVNVAGVLPRLGSKIEPF